MPYSSKVSVEANQSVSIAALTYTTVRFTEARPIKQAAHQHQEHRDMGTKVSAMIRVFFFFFYGSEATLRGNWVSTWGANGEEALAADVMDQIECH